LRGQGNESDSSRDQCLTIGVLLWFAALRTHYSNTVQATTPRAEADLFLLHFGEFLSTAETNNFGFHAFLTLPVGRRPCLFCTRIVCWCQEEFGAGRARSCKPPRCGRGALPFTLSYGPEKQATKLEFASPGWRPSTLTN
jgi:hypothetical protein